MQLPETFKQYREMVQTRGSIEPGYWFGKCANWYMCGSTNLAFVVADMYFATYEDAIANDVEWGMKVCRACHHGVFTEAFTIAMRKRVILKKRHECSDQAETCSRNGTHFIVVNGARRWLCVDHVAIHSEWTQVNRVRSNGQIEDCTWDLNAFYWDHIRAGLVNAS